MAPQKETVIKFTNRRYKKEGVSDEALHTFAAREHAPKASEIQARLGILGVRQYHKPAQIRALLTEGPFASVAPPTWTVDDHDLELVFYVKDMATLGGLMADKEFQELVKAEVDLVDQERAQLSIGWEEVYVEDGKVVNIEGGQSVYQPWVESVKKLTGQ